jgi:hypothetical protein
VGGHGHSGNAPTFPLPIVIPLKLNAHLSQGADTTGHLVPQSRPLVESNIAT